MSATIDRLVAGTFKQFRDAPGKARNDHDAAVEERQEREALPAVALHPAIVADCRRQVSNLQTALVDPDAGPQAATALRAH